MWFVAVSRLRRSGALARFSAAADVAKFVFPSGYRSAWPGFETKLTPDEVNAVAEYVWSDLGA